MNLKKLLEQKNTLCDKVNELCLAAENEERALNAEEIEKINGKLAEIRSIEESIKIEEERRAIELGKGKKGEKEQLADKEKFEIEKRAFDELIRKDVLQYHEERAAVNMTVGDNGAVVPTSIANKIIETVKDVCPIFQLATVYTIDGNLSFPVYNESTDKIQCAYKEEFNDLESSSGKFTNVELKGFLAGVLTKISVSLVNNSAFDVAGYVISKMATAIGEFLERELLLGKDNKLQGIVNSKNIVTTAAEAITADDLIDLQSAIKQRFRGQGRFILNPKTLNALRKLKDTDGKYLLNPDIRTGFGYTLLGSPVEESDVMPTMTAGEMAIAFGDFSGLYVKFTEQLELQVLREKYATQHALGVVGWIEVDSKIVEPQKIAILKIKDKGASL